MKFMLLFIGLVCYVTGLFLMKGDEQKKKGKWLILTGGLLVIANCFYLWYMVNNKIEMSSIVVVSGLIIIFIVVTVFSRDNKFKLGFSSFILLALTLLMTFGGKLPPITLDNGVIKMGGRYGGNFKVSAIQSVDTVSVYPKVGVRSRGAGLPASSIGNFALENEKQTAKLCLYRGNPPYIKIRMNDNSLFILNFKEPEQTVEFYDRLKNVLNSIE